MLLRYYIVSYMEMCIIVKISFKRDQNTLYLQINFKKYVNLLAIPLRALFSDVIHNPSVRNI